MLKQCSINPADLEVRATNCNSWRILCHQVTERFEASQTQNQKFHQQQHHDYLMHKLPLPPGVSIQYPACGQQCAFQFDLCSH